MIVESFENYRLLLNICVIFVFVYCKNAELIFNATIISKILGQKLSIRHFEDIALGLGNINFCVLLKCRLILTVYVILMILFASFEKKSPF